MAQNNKKRNILVATLLFVVGLPFMFVGDLVSVMFTEGSPEVVWLQQNWLLVGLFIAGLFVASVVLFVMQQRSEQADNNPPATAGES